MYARSRLPWSLTAYMVDRNMPTLTERVSLIISTKVIDRVHYGMLLANLCHDIRQDP
jgi:hypothetical protein